MNKNLAFTILCFFSFNLLYSQSGQWTWMKGDSVPESPGSYAYHGYQSSSNNPRARQRTLGFTDASGDFWIFGGGLFDPSTPLFYEYMGDLWKFSPNNNQWIWIKGDNNYPNFLGNYGVKGISSPSNDPPSRESSQGWTDSSGNFWLFGGDIPYITFSTGTWETYKGNDFWKYNISTKKWTWMNGGSLSNNDKKGTYGVKGVPSASNYPGPRIQATTWTDKSGNLWMFGGLGYDKNFGSIGNLNDLWQFNPLTNMWTWVSGDNTKSSLGNYGVRGVTSATNVPQSRNSGQGWTDSSGNLWLFAGQVLNDLWTFNVSTKKWTWMHGDSTFLPSNVLGIKGVSSPLNTPGSFPTLDYSSNLFIWKDKNDLVWLWGESKGLTPHSQSFLMWKYDRFNNQWTWVNGDTTRSITQYYYGTQGVAIPGNYPRSNGAWNTDWMDTDGNFWMMAGALNAMWKYSPNLIFPIHLLSFTSILEDNTTHLKWTAENEQNFSHYEVERSINGKDFSQVKIQKAKGNNGSKQTYYYNDPVNYQSPSVNSFYYRLKMVDRDGKFTYSNIIKVSCNLQHPTFNIYPNPATTSVELQFSKTLHGKASVEVSNMEGKVVMKKVCGVDGNKITLSNILPSGTYSVKVITTDETFIQKMFVQ